MPLPGVRPLSDKDIENHKKAIYQRYKMLKLMCYLYWIRLGKYEYDSNFEHTILYNDLPNACFKYAQRNHSYGLAYFDFSMQDVTETKEKLLANDVFYFDNIDGMHKYTDTNDITSFWNWNRFFINPYNGHLLDPRNIPIDIDTTQEIKEYIINEGIYMPNTQSKDRFIRVPIPDITGPDGEPVYRESYLRDKGSRSDSYHSKYDVIPYSEMEPEAEETLHYMEEGVEVPLETEDVVTTDSTDNVDSIEDIFSPTTEDVEVNADAEELLNQLNDLAITEEEVNTTHTEQIQVHPKSNSLLMIGAGLGLFLMMGN